MVLWTLIEADIGRSRYWPMRTLVEADIGQSGHWSKQTWVKADIGRSRHWSFDKLSMKLQALQQTTQQTSTLANCSQLQPGLWHTFTSLF
jgi:hypothetical protein